VLKYGFIGFHEKFKGCFRVLLEYSGGKFIDPMGKLFRNFQTNKNQYQNMWFLSRNGLIWFRKVKLKVEFSDK
jgi:hypothetical protein